MGTTEPHEIKEIIKDLNVNFFDLGVEYSWLNRSMKILVYDKNGINIKVLIVINKRTMKNGPFYILYLLLASSYL